MVPWKYKYLHEIGKLVQHIDSTPQPDAPTEAVEDEEVYDFDEFGEYGLAARRVTDEDKPG